MSAPGAIPLGGGGGRILAIVLVLLFGLAGCSTAAEDPATSGAGSATMQHRDAAVQAAERTAVALVSLDHRDPDRGYDRLLDLLTGPARQEWEQRRAGQLAMINKEVVTVERAAVRTSGVAALDQAGATATVLVTATAMVSTQQFPAPEKRQYRLRMSLIRAAADTEWKVSELRFVS